MLPIWHIDIIPADYSAFMRSTLNITFKVLTQIGQCAPSNPQHSPHIQP